MQAIFRLTPMQTRKARAIENCVAGEIDKADDVQEKFNADSGTSCRSGVEDCGLYTLETHAATNTEQRVYLERHGYDTYMVVVGHRCALGQDGGIAVAESIVGKDAVPFIYETSDARLRWNETLSSYMKARGTREERVAYILDGRQREWRWFLPEMEACVFTLTRSPAKAYAQFDSEEIRIARKIINCSI